MTPKQRFLAALRLEEPDMVPVAPLIHHRFAHKVLGRTGWRAVFEVHKMVGTIHFRGPIGVEVRAELPQGWEEEWEKEEKPDGRVVKRRILRAPLGTLTATLVSGMIPGDPTTEKWVECPVKSAEDWRIYIAYLERWLEGLREVDISAAEEAYDEMGEEGVPSVGIGSVFSGLGLARGMEGLLYDLYDCPDLVMKAAELIWKQVELEIEGFLRSRSEVMWYDICWATGARMSPEFFQKFELPFCARVVERVRKAKGKFVGFYTLGKMRKILPMLVDTGVHFIETFEPKGDITLAEAKRFYGEKVCLMGNFNCVILARGSVEDARKEALRCLREGMVGGGYVMVTEDEVPADAKLENLRAMVEVAEEFGRYGK